MFFSDTLTGLDFFCMTFKISSLQEGLEEVAKAHGETAHHQTRVVQEQSEKARVLQVQKHALYRNSMGNVSIPLCILYLYISIRQ